jgi:hypothetical protein
MSGPKRGAVEVETADQPMQRVPASEPARVAADVDYASVAAAGDHHQTLAAHVDDQRVVVEHQRVRAPQSLHQACWIGNPGS